MYRPLWGIFSCSLLLHGNAFSIPLPDCLFMKISWNSLFIFSSFPCSLWIKLLLYWAKASVTIRSLEFSGEVRIYIQNQYVLLNILYFNGSISFMKISWHMIWKWYTATAVAVCSHGYVFYDRILRNLGCFWFVFWFLKACIEVCISSFILSIMSDITWYISKCIWTENEKWVTKDVQVSSMTKWLDQILNDHGK